MELFPLHGRWKTDMGQLLSFIDSFRGGSEFETLLRPHVPHLYRLAYRFTGNPSDAEDLVQDLLVKLYPKLKDIRKINKLRPWLAKILYRIFIDLQRKHSRSPLRLTKMEHPDNPANSILDSLPTERPNPEEILERKINQDRLLKAVQALKEDQRHVCILHDIEGYALSEITEILNVPLGTVKSRLHRARENLRFFLKHGTF